MDKPGCQRNFDESSVRDELDLATQHHLSVNESIFPMLFALPNEILEEIVKRLFVRHVKLLRQSGDYCWLSEFAKISDYARVGSLAWMELINKYLEERLVSNINKWCPNRPLNELLPETVPTFSIGDDNLQVLDDSSRVIVVYPPFIVNCDGITPFVGNGLVLTFQYPKADYHGISCIIIEDFSIRYASHLSVLCLTEMHLDMTDFICLLKASENIQILIIQDFKLGVKVEEELYLSILPDMPKLITLKLLLCFHVYITMKNNVRIPFKEFKPLRTNKYWIFNKYAGQLENLELRYYPQLPIDPMPKLKHLSVMWFSTCCDVPSRFGSLNSLKRLSFGDMDSRCVRVERMFKFIGKFSRTLVEIYFHVQLSNSLLRTGVDPYQELKNLHFPNVRKLTMKLPKDVNDDFISMITDFMLKTKFPILEELVFIDYVQPRTPYPVESIQLNNYSSNETPMSNSTPFINKIWLACATLKKIVIFKKLKRAKGMYVPETYGRPTGH